MWVTNISASGGTYKFLLLLLPWTSGFTKDSRRHGAYDLQPRMDNKISWSRRFQALSLEWKLWYFNRRQAVTWTGATCWFPALHYSDVIMSAMASRSITDVSTVCSTLRSGADQIKHQSSVSLAFVQVGFLSQRASNAGNVSIWWHHHTAQTTSLYYFLFA